MTCLSECCLSVFACTVQIQSVSQQSRVADLCSIALYVCKVKQQPMLSHDTKEHNAKATTKCTCNCDNRACSSCCSVMCPFCNKRRASLSMEMTWGLSAQFSNSEPCVNERKISLRAGCCRNGAMVFCTAGSDLSTCWHASRQHSCYWYSVACTTNAVQQVQVIPPCP